MTQQAVAHNIKNRLKFRTKNEKIEELKKKQHMDNSAGNLKEYQQIRTNPWCGYVAQG
jgi:hypothetical protein